MGLRYSNALLVLCVVITALVVAAPVTATLALERRHQITSFVGRGQTREAGLLLEKGELHDASRPVPLLADDDLGHVLVFRLLLLRSPFVHLFAVDEHHQIRVLLKCARLT